MRFINFDSVVSTNLEALKFAEEGDKGPLWVSAVQQTGGRGRRGRPWVSKSGNLYCSGLYPHAGNAQSAALYSFVAVLAIADLVRTYLPESHVTLKWPNDVLIDGKKTSGVLLEHSKGWIVAGIGVNLVSHPGNAEFPATHILEHIPEEALNKPEPLIPEPQAALAILAARFDVWRSILINDGFAPIKSAWEGLAQNVPGPLIVRLHNETFSGEATALGENGELQVRLKNGTIRNVHSGDVFFN